MTPKQRLFVKNYLIDLNATQAAIRAGYSAKGADVVGSNLLGNIRVAAAIQKAMDERAERLDITADRVLQEIAKIAFTNATDVMEWGPNGVGIRPSGELTDVAKSAVAEVAESATKEGDILVKVKMHDKLGALRDLGRHLKLFTEKVEVEDVSLLTVEERADRTLAILDAARARRTQ